MTEVGLSLPGSNAWPERGGSVINITKTKFHNRLSNDMLNSLMQVSINAPESGNCGDIFKAAVGNWLKKSRKNLKRVRVTSRPLESSQLQVDAETQEEELREGAEGEAPEAEGTTQDESPHDNEVAAAADEAAAVAVAAAIGLPEFDYDSAIESDCEVTSFGRKLYCLWFS